MSGIVSAVRWSKILLLASVALLFSLVVINNTTDFDSNFQFVRHVLAMDSTFPGNRLMWRALPYRGAHLSFYLVIIAWELLSAVLCWVGVAALFRARASSPEAFVAAKRFGAWALTAGLVMWLSAFLAVGGEWFLMWQSATWNGQQAAARMFVVEGLILIFLVQPEP